MSALITLIRNIKINGDYYGDYYEMFFLSMRANSPASSEAEISTISLVPERIPVKFERSIVSTTVSNDFIVESNLMSGLNYDDIIKKTLINESEHGKEKSIYSTLKELAKKTEFDERTDFEKLMFKWFGYEPKEHFTENQASDLVRKIIYHCNLVGKRSRLGPGNFIIVGPRLGSIISDSSIFTFSDVNEKRWGTGLSYSIGTLAGNIKVVVNPYIGYNDETVIIGRSTKENNEGTYLFERNEPVIDKIQVDHFNFRVSLIEMTKVITTPKAYLNYYIMTVTNKKHTLLTFLWNKLKNKIKGNGK
jgi:hypothetical protein